MNKFLLICVTCFFSCHCFSQTDQRPSRSRFYNSKFSTFSISPGDILVYEVKNGDTTYNYVATVKKYGSDINFDYTIPQRSVTGQIIIPAVSIAAATKYDTLNSNGSLDNTSVLWLSQKNFSELFDERQTTMTFDDTTETYVRKMTTTLRINYKGKEKIITVYNIENNGGKAYKSFAVLTTETNPLIIKMNSREMVTLKEVR